MTNTTPPADDRVHSAEENEKAIQDAKKLEEADLPQDEEDRLTSYS